MRRLHRKKDFFLKSPKFEEYIINNIAHKEWIYNPEFERLKSILKSKYAKRHGIKSFEYKNEILQTNEALVYSEYCPINKRQWKSGINKDKPYAKIEDDCSKCNYCLGSGKHEIYGTKTDALLDEENAIYCIGHMSSSLDLDIYSAIQKHKKKIKSDK